VTAAERAQLEAAMKEAQEVLSRLWWEVIQPEPNARIVYGVWRHLENTLAPVADWAFHHVLTLNALRGKSPRGSDEKTNTPPDPAGP
jgi:hypothetical protein